jgi:ATP-dependent Clp protease ATP-binding subunit ClpA
VFRPGITQTPPKNTGRIPTSKTMTANAKRALMYATDRAAGPEVTTCDLLMGLLMANEGLAAQVLMNLGVTFEKAKASIEAMTEGKR